LTLWLNFLRQSYITSNDFKFWFGKASFEKLKLKSSTIKIIIMTKKKTKKQLVKERLDELFDKKELVTSLEVYSTDNTYKEYSYDVKIVSEYIKENNIDRDTRINLHPSIQDRLPGVHNRSVIYFRSGTIERLIRESAIDKILNDKS